MNGNISRFVKKVVVGNPINMGALTVFPLSWQEGGEGKCKMAVLDEVIDGGKVLVEEVSEEGRVPEISVKNDLDQDLFILEGEEVRGARQNRVLNISVCIGAKTRVTIPVTCVEQGRWYPRSRRFSSGKRASFRMRRDSSRSVSESAKRMGKFRSDQMLMWENVMRELNRVHASSPTEAFEAAFERVEPEINAHLEKGVELPPETAGVAIALGKRVVSAEIFGTAALFKKLRDKIFSAYLFDAYGIKKGHKRPTREDAESFLRKAESVGWTERKSPGKGNQIRLEGPDVTGGALMVDDELTYACLMSLN